VILNLGIPNKKQDMFLRCTTKYIGYGGARGGGKSWAIRAKAALLALRYSNLNIIILRRTFPELNENHILPLLVMLNGIAKYREKDKVFSFGNGSRIKVGYCNSDKDILQYQGQSYDVIMIDECTQFKYEWVQFILTTLRTTRDDGFKTRAYFTGNPGGVGHNWFKRLFVKGEYQESENREDYTFIPATVDDNLVLMSTDPDYVALLDSLPEKLKQAHRYGNWDIFDGQFFEEFRDYADHYKDRKWTHVIDPFEIPETWTIYRSFDYGYSKPFSVGWWAVDYDGRLYRFMEMYGCTKTPDEGVKWTSEKIFKEIRDIETQHRWLKGKDIIGIADPAIWQRESSGISIADVAANGKVYFNKADNTRIAGWQQMHTRMEFDENGIPMMYVFSTCRQFIRTIPLQMYDQNKPEDLDTKGEDHIADDSRYMCMHVPMKPIIKKEKKIYSLEDPLNMTVDLLSERRYNIV
jgi:phage terminase large subunit